MEEKRSFKKRVTGARVLMPQRVAMLAARKKVKIKIVKLIKKEEVANAALTSGKIGV